MSQRSLLLILAHPDDEAFMAAGTIAKYLSEGCSVSLVTATLGDRGKTGGLCSSEELAELRRNELRNALEILGLERAILLGYLDRELERANPDEMRRTLVKIIRDHAPQVVITFDPNGANTHPDHVAISRFTTDAVNAAADPRWYPELGPPVHVARYLWQSPTRVYDLAHTPNLASQPGIDFLIDVSPWWHKKEQALRAHASQVPGFHSLWFEKPTKEFPDIPATLSLEAFRLACGPPPSTHPAPDLFDGL